MIDRTFMQAKALFKRPSFEEESRKKWASFWCLLKLASTSNLELMRDTQRYPDWPSIGMASP